MESRIAFQPATGSTGSAHSRIVLFGGAESRLVGEVAVISGEQVCRPRSHARQGPETFARLVVIQADDNFEFRVIKRVKRFEFVRRGPAPHRVTRVAVIGRLSQGSGREG